MENGCLQAKNAGSLYPVGKIAEKAVCRVYFWQHGNVCWVPS